MSVTSGFFNSLNGDRRYTAEQMSALFDGLINDGIFATVGSAFSITASGTSNEITVGVGRAWFNHTWLYNDAILPMMLGNSEVLLDRIDAIVIEINHTESIRAGSIRIINGTPASKPERPTMVELENVHQYPLAYIYRAAGSTSVNQSNITNMIGSGSCPYVTGILQVVDIENIVAQWGSEFSIWFEGLQTSFEGDIAVELTNRVIALESQFATLAKEGAVYDTIEDSNGDPIIDSYGTELQGATVFAHRGSEIPGAPGSNDRYLPIDGGVMSGPINMNENAVLNLPKPIYDMEPIRWMDCIDESISALYGLKSIVLPSTLFRKLGNAVVYSGGLKTLLGSSITIPASGVTGLTINNVSGSLKVTSGTYTGNGVNNNDSQSIRTSLSSIQVVIISRKFAPGSYAEGSYDVGMATPGYSMTINPSQNTLIAVGGNVITVTARRSGYDATRWTYPCFNLNGAQYMYTAWGT